MAAIGRVLLIAKGNYSGSAIYNALDWVRDNGAAWVCKVDGTQGIAPPTLPATSNANWQVLAEDGSVSGAVDWSNVNNKPFDDVLSNGGLEVDANNKLKLDTNYLIGSNIGYDNTSSGMSATNVQQAIDELKAGGGGTSYTASKGIKISSGDIQADLVANTPSSNASVTRTSTANREYAVELDSNNKLAVNVPWTDTTPNNGALNIQQNGVSAYTGGTSFNADSSAGATANIITDDWVTTTGTDGIVQSDNTVTFSGIDDTTSYGYDLYCNGKLISITNLSVTNAGTASMTLVYTVSGAAASDVCKLRRVK